MRKILRAFIFLFLSAGGLSSLWADAPGIINYQGKLTDSDGNPITDNAGVGIVFSLYDVPSGGSFLYQDSRTVPVDNGVFVVQIGSTTGGIPKTIFQTNTTLYLGVRVGADAEMTPRERLVAAPYALAVATNSVGANEILDSTITLSKIDTVSFDSRYLTALPSTMTVSYSVYMATSSGKVGVGTLSPSYLLHVTTAADVNGTVFAVSTGSVDLFSVLGTSVNLKVPLVFPDGTVQATAAGGTPTSVSSTGDAIITADSDANRTGIVRLRTGSTSVLTVSTNAYVGIGTTNPRYPLEILNGSDPIIALSDGSNDNFISKTGIRLNPYSKVGFNEDISEFHYNATEPAYSFDLDMITYGGRGDLQIRAGLPGEGPIDYRTAIVVSSKAYVGIGNNFSPSYLLHVSTIAGISDTVFAVSTGPVDLFRVSGTSAALQVPLYFQDGTSMTSTSAFAAAGSVAAHQATHVDGGSDQLTGSLTLTTATLTGANFSVGDSTLTVTGGKVGVGTTSPSYQLHLATGAAATGTLFAVSTGPVDLFRVSGTSAALQVPLYFQDGTSMTSTSAFAAAGSVAAHQATHVDGGSDQLTGSLTLTTATLTGANFSVGDSTLTVTGGKVGVGTTSPSYQLHLATGAAATGTLFAVSTGPVDLFRVSGTSAALQVPLYFPDGTVQTTAAGAVAAHQATHVDGGSDQLTGSLTLTTATLTGSAFSVGTSTLVVTGGKVGIGTTNPSGALDVKGQMGSEIFVKGNVSGDITIDWNDGNTQHITLTGNLTSLTFNNGLAGRKYTLIIKQGGAGGYTISWAPAAVRWSGAAAPDLTTAVGKTDYIGFFYNSVDSTYDGVAMAFNY